MNRLLQYLPMARLVRGGAIMRDGMQLEITLCSFIFTWATVLWGVLHGDATSNSQL